MNKSWSGNLFCNLEVICGNTRSFLSNHYYTANILFLILYIVLQLALIFFISVYEIHTKFIVSVFIILFLFLISLERIILQFKSKQSQEEKDIAEQKFYELKGENKILREKDKNLLEVIQGLKKKR